MKFPIFIILNFDRLEIREGCQMISDKLPVFIINLFLFLRSEAIFSLEFQR